MRRCRQPFPPSPRDTPWRVHLINAITPPTLLCMAGPLLSRSFLPPWEAYLRPAARRLCVYLRGGARGTAKSRCDGRGRADGRTDRRAAISLAERPTEQGAVVVVLLLRLLARLFLFLSLPAFQLFSLRSAAVREGAK